MKNKIGYCEWIFAANGPLGMKIASGLGYEGVQLTDLGGSTAGYPFSNPRVREGYLEASEQYHMELQHMHLYTLVRQGLMNQPMNSAKGELAMESIRKGVENCAAMHIPGMMLSAFFDTTINSPYELKNFSNMLNYACDLGGDLGVQITLECVAPIDRILHMIERSKGRLKICYDTQNPVRNGSGNPIDEIRALGVDAIDHIHLKDASEAFDRNLPLGSGCVGFDATMKLLHEMGYQGWYVTENYYERVPFCHDGDPYELARKDAETVRSYF